MPREVLLKSGKIMKDDPTVGLKYGTDEVLTTSDADEVESISQNLIDTHESTYNHTNIHTHSNKVTLDAITNAGSGVIITTSERNKLASIDATHYGAPLQTLVALSAIPEASCNDKERRFVEDELSDYFYDSSAVSGDVAPDDQTGGTGFWRKVAVDGETAASIKTKYESNANTNAFTDAEQSKLSSITDVGSGVIISAGERVRVTAYGYTEIHVVTAGEITQGYLTLQGNPLDAGGLRVEEVNGIAYINKDTYNATSYNPDFELLNDNELHINNNGAGTGLDNTSIVEGDVLLISYMRKA